MNEMPASPYVEARGRRHYIAGTRISIDSIAYAFRRGETVEDILEDFPSLQSGEKLDGAIAFVRAHPVEIETYLAEGERLQKELEGQNPPEIVERIRKYDEARGRKIACTELPLYSY
jgi:uncharacterized protein (DUF433 family)